MLCVCEEVAHRVCDASLRTVFDGMLTCFLKFFFDFVIVLACYGEWNGVDANWNNSYVG